MTALKPPCCEEAQAHLHRASCGEVLRLKKERDAQPSPAAQPSASPSPDAVWLWDYEPEPPSCPLSKFLAYRIVGGKKVMVVVFKP